MIEDNYKNIKTTWLEELNNEKEQLRKVQQEQKNTLDSIFYARKIQDAILIGRGELENIFGDFAIVYEPKNIVSGDFYYAQKKGNKKYLVVADCTGHGVPGAFMSILCNDFLIRAMKTKSLPNEILNRVNELLIKRLRVDEKNEITDGMDVGVAHIDYDAMKINYSGAMNDGVLITANNEFTLLKSTRKSIGNCFRIKNFSSYELHTVDFKKGDILYLFSDGFKDQINKEGKKIGMKLFLNTLSEMYSIELKKQQTLLTKMFNRFVADVDQLDDVLVLGIRL